MVKQSEFLFVCIHEIITCSDIILLASAQGSYIMTCLILCLCYLSFENVEM